MQQRRRRNWCMMIARLNKGRIVEHVHGWRKIFRKFSPTISTSSTPGASAPGYANFSCMERFQLGVKAPRSIIRSLIRGSRWYNICCNFIRTSFHYPCPTRTIHLRFSARSCVPTYRFILEFLRSIRSYSRHGDHHVPRARTRIPIRFAKLAPTSVQHELSTWALLLNEECDDMYFSPIGITR